MKSTASPNHKEPYHGLVPDKLKVLKLILVSHSNNLIMCKRNILHLCNFETRQEVHCNGASVHCVIQITCEKKTFFHYRLFLDIFPIY